MTDEELVLPAFAEWEMLRTPLSPFQAYSSGPIFESPYFPQWVETVIASRAQNYEIEAVFLGPAPIRSNFQPSAAPNPLTIVFTDPINAVWHVTGCIKKHEARNERGPEGEWFRRIRTYMQVEELVVEDRPGHETVRLTEWFLNGPKTPLLYPGATKREIRVQRTRHRHGLRAGTDRFQMPTPEKGHGARDFVRVRYGARSFLLHAVPESVGVAWSDNVGIEYRAEWGGIPEALEREAISDVVGFVLGRRLLLVGHTEVGSDQLVTRRSAIPPNTTHAETLCRMGDRPPVWMVYQTSGRMRSRLQNVLQQVVPKYLERMDDYNLGGALYRHATAREVPLGVDLPLFQSAVEMISKRWRRTQKQHSQADPGVYMRKKDFDRIFAAEMASMKRQLSTRSIQQVLTRQKYGQRLLRKMERGYEMSGNELLELFFDGIRLPLGEVERNAMRARNIATHGSMIPVAEMPKWAAHRDAYYTLVNRVILRVLGYRGGYLDYTALPPIPRKLREPASGRDVPE